MVEPLRREDCLELGQVQKALREMDTFDQAKDLSWLSNSETDLGGTVCGKAARTGLWGSGEVTNRSTWTPI